jgi:hypothetical protein
MLLGQTWGARFVDQYGTAPNEAWTAALACIGPEAARDAFKALIASGSGFPPTLPEFVAAARKASSDRARERRNAMTLAELPAPPAEASPEAQANLAKLRDLLQ